MSSMTDPMNALAQLQLALDNRIVSLQQCDIHKDIYVIADRPNGAFRYTYAKVEDDKVQSIALFASTEPIEGILCFQMGWATLESLRKRGLATEMATKGVDELFSG
jgi:hypothetical protein